MKVARLRRRFSPHCTRTLLQPATASATVTVKPAAVACATGAVALTLKDKEVQWKLTNGTARLGHNE